MRAGDGTSVGSGGRSVYMAYQGLPMGQLYYWYAWSVDNQNDVSANAGGPHSVIVDQNPGSQR